MVVNLFSLTDGFRFWYIWKLWLEKKYQEEMNDEVL